MMFVKTILFITFVSTQINSATNRSQDLPEAQSVSLLHAVDLKKAEQDELLIEINKKIKNTYDFSELKTYIEEKLSFASESGYPRVISRLSPEDLMIQVVPSQTFYKSLLNKAAERGCIESVTILSDICARDNLFENIRHEIAFNKLSPWQKFLTNKYQSKVLTTLAALNVCRIIMYDGFDAYEILFQTSGIIGVGSCLFPIRFIPRTVNVSIYNTDPLIEAYTIALRNNQNHLAHYLGRIIRQKNPQANLTEINPDLL